MSTVSGVGIASPVQYWSAAKESPKDEDILGERYAVCLSGQCVKITCCVGENPAIPADTIGSTMDSLFKDDLDGGRGAILSAENIRSR
jgi:hypothetical protein